MKRAESTETGRRDHTRERRPVRGRLCSYGALGICIIVLLTLAPLLKRSSVQAQQSSGVGGAEITIDAGSGLVTLEHDVVPGHYYIVRRGMTPAEPLVAVDIALPDRGGILRDSFPDLLERAFYQIQQVPIDEPLDTDGDRIDDVYELMRLGVLNALEGGDAQSDPDGNGLSHLSEYLEAKGLLTTILDTAPADRENGIAVTRESIVRLSAPLSSAVSVPEAAFTAEYGGQSLSTRLHLSRDRQKLTLFYNDPLPASGRVRLHVDGDLLQDEIGRLVDADNDGTPGGQYTFSFDTLGLTVIPDLAVCGRVIASELVVGGNGNWVNRPLGGATITVDGMENLLRATTDEFGNFRLAPVPAGRFFVHIDGRTVTANVSAGAYYPFVGKTWTAGPGVAAAQDGPPITEGLQVWLTARAGTGNPANGAPIPTWTDQAHGHVFNAPNALVPTFVTDAGGGFPAIDFERSSGFFGDFSSTAGATISDATIFVVGRFEGYTHGPEFASFLYSIDSSTGGGEHTLGRDEDAGGPDALYHWRAQPAEEAYYGDQILEPSDGTYTTYTSVFRGAGAGGGALRPLSMESTASCPTEMGIPIPPMKRTPPRHALACGRTAPAGSMGAFARCSSTIAFSHLRRSRP